MVEQLGSGVPRILKAYSKDNFIFMEHFIRMNFPAIEPVYEKDSGKTSGKTSGKILLLIGKTPDITIPEMSKEIGVTERSIERNIEKLKKEGRLRRIGPDKGGHWEVVEL